MSRMVSFFVLLAILLLCIFLVFKVMAGFLLPMFLAALLVVIFRPLHHWYRMKCEGHPRVAAGLTTGTIMLIVMLPMCLIIFGAAYEGATWYQNATLGNLNEGDVARAIADGAKTIGFELKQGDVEATIREKVELWLQPVALSMTKFLGRFLIGLGVMIVSLYYFLADGPGMIRTVMRLSPLDDKYEEQLIEEFVTVSRAVVMATLVSAVVQGILAGIGFAIAGLGSVFLLVLLTMLFAMIPFVGAAAVWLPVSLWLMFVEQRTAAAVVLAIYGAGIVSTSDNIVKPMILHGRSKLHPLLALLSVLGGVGALGPIGIFVGPMVVAFLQTLLQMLHTELESLSSGIRWTPVWERE